MKRLLVINPNTSNLFTKRIAASSHAKQRNSESR